MMNITWLNQGYTPNINLLSVIDLDFGSNLDPNLGLGLDLRLHLSLVCIMAFKQSETVGL